MSIMRNEKALAVVEKALDLLDRVQPAKGHYLRRNLPPDENWRDEDSLQDRLDLFVQNCKVCGLGLLYLAHVALHGGVTIADLVRESRDSRYVLLRRLDAVDRLCDVLPEEDLNLIETAFEQLNWLDNLGDELATEALEFGAQYHELDDRLRAILRRLLENGGHFIPKEVATSPITTPDYDLACLHV